MIRRLSGLLDPITEQEQVIQWLRDGKVDEVTIKKSSGYIMVFIVKVPQDFTYGENEQQKFMDDLKLMQEQQKSGRKERKEEKSVKKKERAVKSDAITIGKTEKPKLTYPFDQLKEKIREILESDDGLRGSLLSKLGNLEAGVKSEQEEPAYRELTGALYEILSLWKYKIGRTDLKVVDSTGHADTEYGKAGGVKAIQHKFVTGERWMRRVKDAVMQLFGSGGEFPQTGSICVADIALDKVASKEFRTQELGTIRQILAGVVEEVEKEAQETKKKAEEAKREAHKSPLISASTSSPVLNFTGKEMRIKITYYLYDHDEITNRVTFVTNGSTSFFKHETKVTSPKRRQEFSFTTAWAKVISQMELQDRLLQYGSLKGQLGI